MAVNRPAREIAQLPYCTRSFRPKFPVRTTLSTLKVGVAGIFIREEEPQQAPAPEEAPIAAPVPAEAPVAVPAPAPVAAPVPVPAPVEPVLAPEAPIPAHPANEPEVIDITDGEPVVDITGEEPTNRAPIAAPVPAQAPVVAPVAALVPAPEVPVEQPEEAPEENIELPEQILLNEIPGFQRANLLDYISEETLNKWLKG